MRVLIDTLSQVVFPGILAHGIGVNLAAVAAVRMEVNPVEIPEACRLDFRKSVITGMRNGLNSKCLVYFHPV